MKKYYLNMYEVDRICCILNDDLNLSIYKSRNELYTIYLMLLLHNVDLINVIENANKIDQQLLDKEEAIEEVISYINDNADINISIFKIALSNIIDFNNESDDEVVDIFSNPIIRNNDKLSIDQNTVKDMSSKIILL